MLDPAIVNGAYKYIKVHALCVGASAFASVPLKRCTTGSEFVDKIRFKLDLDLAVEVHHSGQMRNTLPLVLDRCFPIDPKKYRAQT